MKKMLTALAAGTLMSLAGLASAAEPMQLTDSQMDSVAAGNAPFSWAATGGHAERGIVISAAITGASERNGNRSTFAAAATLARGHDVSAFAAAGSGF